MREDADLLDRTPTWAGCSGLQGALAHHSGLSFPWAWVSALVQFCFPAVLASVELKCILLTSCDGQLEVSSLNFSTAENSQEQSLHQCYQNKTFPWTSLVTVFWIKSSLFSFWFQTVKIPEFPPKQTQWEREAVVPLHKSMFSFSSCTSELPNEDSLTWNISVFPFVFFYQPEVAGKFDRNLQIISACS